jgi:hypothetical protein
LCSIMLHALASLPLARSCSSCRGRSPPCSSAQCSAADAVP